MMTEMVPNEVQRILAFLNTRYGHRQRLHDAWQDHVAMANWLREQGLIATDSMVTEGDYRRAIALREALRQSLRRADDGGTTAAEALATINHTAQHTLLKVHFSGPSQLYLVPESGGVDGVLAGILGDVYTAAATRTLDQLKICQNGACSRAFYDGSKNHSGVWCSTRLCGNRAHARTYRQQKKRIESS